MRSHRRGATFVVTCLIGLSALVLGASSATAGSAKKGLDGYANDPRSGAALNRDAAQYPGPMPPALFRGNRVINTPAVNNPAADATAQDTQSETTVAADGTNVVVAYNDSGSNVGGASHFTGFASSANSGVSFTDQGALPNSAAGDAGDPALAINNATNDVFLTTLGFNAANQIPIFRSTTGGASFGAPVNSVPGGVNLDKEWLAVDNFAGPGNGNLYVCVTDFGFSPARIVVTHSIDNGATWAPAGGVVLSSSGQSQGCYVAVGPDHSVYVAYFRGNAPNALFIRRSTDGGVSFGAENQIATLNTTSVNGNLALNGGLRSNSFPHMAVNPVSGHIIAVWNDDPAPAGGVDRGDIYYSRSTNNGTTWSAPVKVNDDDARDQFFPTVGISEGGHEIMFGYYSRSHDADNLLFHRRIRPALMNTTTGALNMRRSAQLSPDTPIAIGQDPAINPVYMGDYDVIEANATTFFSTWADNRDGNSFHARQPDVFIARVARTAPSTTTDVDVTVTPTPATINEGGATTLQVEATATGHAARDVYVSLGRATGLTMQSATGGCEVINGIVGCNLGTIPAGTTKQRNVTALGTSAGSRTATARVTTTDNDTNQANNVGSGTVTVNPVAGTTSTYSSGNIAVPIPVTGIADVPINVAPAGTVLDIDAMVRLDHTYDSDLSISLISPGGGTTVDLSSNNGGSGDNYGTATNDCSGGGATRFNDAAASLITAGAAPFAGTYSPEGSLADFNGLNQAGQWTLRVNDTFSGDSGTIGCVKLIIKRP